MLSLRILFYLKVQGVNSTTTLSFRPCTDKIKDTKIPYFEYPKKRKKDYRSAERSFLHARRRGHPEADQALEGLNKQK